jgi:putative transposase
MPRKSRIDAPGALHHIMVRGIDRQDIFSNQKDYSAFMDRLGDLLMETNEIGDVGKKIKIIDIQAICC